MSWNITFTRFGIVAILKAIYSCRSGLKFKGFLCCSIWTVLPLNDQQIDVTHSHFSLTCQPVYLGSWHFWVPGSCVLFLFYFFKYDNCNCQLHHHILIAFVHPAHMWSLSCYSLFVVDRLWIFITMLQYFRWCSYTACYSSPSDFRLLERCSKRSVEI
jgi:hypothetical protein